MIHFECDYLEGAHPRIMARMMETNMEQNPGYGEDPHCGHARELIAAGFNRLSIPTPTEPIRAAVRTRYHQTERPATVYPLAQNKVRIVFDEPQRAITPGQAAVLYEGELVLGGGTIIDGNHP